MRILSEEDLRAGRRGGARQGRRAGGRSWPTTASTASRRPSSAATCTRALAVARRIKSGICHVNGPTVQDEAQMPFGGVKASGYGRFGGKAGIEAFTELRWITDRGRRAALSVLTVQPRPKRDRRRRADMKRRHFLATAAGALAAPALLRPGFAQAPEYTLKLHHLLGPKSPAQTQMLEPWSKAVEEGIGGRVKIEIYPAMSLGGSPPQLVAPGRRRRGRHRLDGERLHPGPSPARRGRGGVSEGRE